MTRIIPRLWRILLGLVLDRLAQLRDERTRLDTLRKVLATRGRTRL